MIKLHGMLKQSLKKSALMIFMGLALLPACVSGGSGPISRPATENEIKLAEAAYFKSAEIDVQEKDLFQKHYKLIYAERTDFFPGTAISLQYDLVSSNFDVVTKLGLSRSPNVIVDLNSPSSKVILFDKVPEWLKERNNKSAQHWDQTDQ